MHLSLLEDYPEYTTIYTDGSANNIKSAAGVWSEGFTLQARLPNNTPILTCELYAIYIALTYASTLPGKFLLFTDSLSAVESLKCPHNSNNYLTHLIAEYVQGIPGKTAIQWVPSHVLIPGNERADALATSAANLPNITAMKLNADDLKGTVRKHYRDVWTSEFRSYYLSSISSICPSMPINYS